MTDGQYYGVTLDPIDVQVLEELEEQLKEQVPQKEEIDFFTFGYTKEGEKVVGLGLYNEGLTSLPESIGNLTNLTELYSQYNQLTSLPENIGQLTDLQILKLEVNQLTSLPENIGQLSILQSLYLSINQLSSLPESMGQLTNLINLSLGFNPLTSLPEKAIQRLKDQGCYIRQ